MTVAVQRYGYSMRFDKHVSVFIDSLKIFVYVVHVNIRFIYVIYICKCVC